MTPPIRAIVRDGFASRLALFYGAAFAIHGIQLPFFPAWLKAKGLDSEAIGIRKVERFANQVIRGGRIRTDLA